ncbi:putative replication protein [Pseudoalteromonas virus vB_PspP-H6/1]|nr:putative replication protein [Pseudoalteromonas virus vB_PspP-H6/1]
MAVYSFDTDIANLVGVNAATIYHNMNFWIIKNKANNNNYRDGNWWVYNSVKAWQELFPFMTIRAVRTALDKLVEYGLIEKGEYNQKGYDKTAWYAICQYRQMDLSETANGFVNNDKPIPVSNPVSNPIEEHVRPDGLTQSDIKDEMQEALNAFIDCWRDCKKRMGVPNRSTRKQTTEKWEKYFSKSWWSKHTITDFENEVNDIMQYANEIHVEDETGFCPARNMMTGNFFTAQGWK